MEPLDQRELHGVRRGEARVEDARRRRDAVVRHVHQHVLDDLGRLAAQDQVAYHNPENLGCWFRPGILGPQSMQYGRGVPPSIAREQNFE